VRASAAGVVTFAGAIGRQRFVTVLHADGLRTSYAFLATVEVRAGQVVAQGDVVGTSGVSVHFGVRRGTVYLDPELLLDGWRPVARLVPTDGGPGRASGAAPCASPARPCVSPARPLAASERGRSAPDGPCGGSATMTSRPASGEPLDHERPATCGRPPGRGRARHQNRRKET
jgi:murein DD-endopeptidase MepM/ murein hydrolase activator NlpD